MSPNGQLGKQYHYSSDSAITESSFEMSLFKNSLH